MTSPYELGLPKNAANHVALTPVSFLSRAAAVHPERIAIIHGAIRRTWAETEARCKRLASALQKRGIRRGRHRGRDAAERPRHGGGPLRRAHDGRGALRAQHAAGCGEHRLHARARRGEGGAGRPRAVRARWRARWRSPGGTCWSSTSTIPSTRGQASASARSTTRRCSPRAIPRSRGTVPTTSGTRSALNYTSGTTGNPKGVVYHHRGAYLNAVSNVLEWDMPKHPVYLWTLPMFHCNGWCFAWTIAARAGVNVCLRKVEAKAIFDAIREHGVTHYCGAPIVHSHAGERARRGARGRSARGPRDDRRCSAACCNDRGDGGARLRPHARLRPDGDLRPRRRVREARELERAADRRAREAERAPGGALPPARGHRRPRPRDHEARAARRRDDGRGHVPRQHHHEGLPEEPHRHGASLRWRLVPHGRSRRA